MAKAKISQMPFGTRMVKMANKSIHIFIKVLKVHKINDCASDLFYRVIVRKTRGKHHQYTKALL